MRIAASLLEDSYRLRSGEDGRSSRRKHAVAAHPYAEKREGVESDTGAALFAEHRDPVDDRASHEMGESIKHLVSVVRHARKHSHDV